MSPKAVHRVAARAARAQLSPAFPFSFPFYVYYYYYRK